VAEVVIEWVPGAIEEMAASDPGIGAAMDMLAGKLVLAMKARCPVSADMPDSGRMRSSIRFVPAPGNERLVGPDTDYTNYVVFGTRPHVIKPRNKQALYWPGAPYPVAVVHHPGTKPNPFMIEALGAIAGETVVV